jgi:hypothetical protein
VAFACFSEHSLTEDRELWRTVRSPSRSAYAESRIKYVQPSHSSLNPPLNQSSENGIIRAVLSFR